MLFYDANYCMIQRCKKTFFILATFFTFLKVFFILLNVFYLKKTCIEALLGLQETIILEVDRRSCCQHWKIARGRSVRYIIRKMVEFICLEDAERLQTMPRTVIYLNQAYSVLYQSPSRAKAVFVTQTQNHSAFE